MGLAGGGGGGGGVSAGCVDGWSYDCFTCSVLNLSVCLCIYNLDLPNCSPVHTCILFRNRWTPSEIIVPPQICTVRMKSQRSGQVYHTREG